LKPCIVVKCEKAATPIDKDSPKLEIKENNARTSHRKSKSSTQGPKTAAILEGLIETVASDAALESKQGDVKSNPQKPPVEPTIDPKLSDGEKNATFSNYVRLSKTKQEESEGKQGDQNQTIQNAAVHAEKGMAGKVLWGPWTACSVTCGVGRSSRMAKCEESDQCMQTDEYFQSKPCRSPACYDGVTGSDMETNCLPLHNEFRRRHGAETLEWSEDLYKKASEIADRISMQGVDENDIHKYEQPGLNLAVIHLDNPLNNKTTATPCTKAVEEWYKEKLSYNFELPRLSAENRDFTQMVWKGTQKMALGKAMSTDGKLAYIAAIYQPAGNIDSYYDMKKNALPVQPRFKKNRAPLSFSINC